MSGYYFILLVRGLFSYFLCVEAEESKGGEGRDSGERGPFPQDGEGGGQGSPGREEGPVQGAEAELCAPEPEQLPGRDEVLSAEGQPLHSQQEPPGVRGRRWGHGAGLFSSPPGAPLLSRAPPQGADVRSRR